MKPRVFDYQYIVLALLLCLSAFYSNAQEIGFETDGLIAFYPLEGSPTDATTNGNDALVKGAILTTDRFGRPDKAYEFNGSNSFLMCNIPTLPIGAAPRTVSLWAKAKLPPSGINLIWWGTAQNRKAFGIINNSAPYTWQGQSWGGGDDVNSGIPVDTNWHQVVVAYNSSAFSIFLDGKLRGNLSIALNTVFSPMIIGAAYDLSIPGTNANTGFFDGAINDVRIYDRALSSEEILKLYSLESVSLHVVLLPTVRIQAVTNKFYTIQFATNLITPDWQILVSNVLIQSNPFYFPDTNGLTQPRRFYRVIEQ